MIDGTHQEIKNERHGRDRRSLVLVLVGLGILIPHLIALLLSFTTLRVRPSENVSLVWTDRTDHLPEGLYWLDNNGLHINQDKRFSWSTHLPTHAAPLFFQPISINLADRDTLMIIPGIGSKIAEAIIQYRDRAGGIKDKETLMKIDGIGSKKSATITDNVNFDD
ncbi:MAG: helix-hairpin-helix domain-containing protein [Proteobacteria bacterium]|nr:helix-hairpin-helix domain-containing protein [Pseudomonadota bacterium]